MLIISGTTSDSDFIDSKIVEFNNQQAPFTQSDPFINLCYVIKEQQTTIAGITAMLYCWNILYINVLWVDERYRNQGFGSALFEKVEQEAQKYGSTLAHLDTFDFQAKNFYLKHGYEIFGQLTDCPPGHTKYFMKKKL